MDGFPDKEARANLKDGLIATLAAKIRKLEEKNVNHVAEKKVKKDPNTQHVAQLLRRVEQEERVKNGARSQAQKMKACKMFITDLLNRI